jgi:hypothetical protein
LLNSDYSTDGSTSILPPDYYGTDLSRRRARVNSFGHGFLRAYHIRQLKDHHHKFDDLLFPSGIA